MKEMGFFSSIFGWDKSMGAMNAVLANHLFEKCSDETKKIIALQIVEIVKSVYPRMSLDNILKDLNKASRVAQMNFVALACDNLNIPPLIPNNTWTRIDNPYRVADGVDIDRINIAISAILIQDRVQLNWPKKNERINFSPLVLASNKNMNSHAKKITKAQVAGRIANICNYIIDDAGIKTLYSGSFILKSDFSCPFVSGKANKEADTLAVVHVSTLEYGKLLYEFDGLESANVEGIFDHLIEPMALEVIEKFSTQSIDFAGLDLGQVF